MMDPDFLYSIVIPVRNEQGSLTKLQEEIDQTMANLKVNYEVIYVNDASSDASEQIIKELRGSNPNIRLISFNKNQGQSAALWAGFKASRGQWIITIDADGQNPPAEIPKLLAIKDRPYDCVTGVRTMRKDSSARKAASWLAHFFRKFILGDTTQDTGCSLRIFKSEIITSFPCFKNFHRFFIFLLRSQSFRVKEVPVKHRKRSAGETKYNNLTRLGEGIIDIWGVFWLKKRLINYSTKNER
jgi:dolichol-phosphate mannosyltransferase